MIQSNRAYVARFWQEKHAAPSLPKLSILVRDRPSWVIHRNEIGPRAKSRACGFTQRRQFQKALRP